MSDFAVIGLGSFGMGLARALARLGARVTAIDNEMAHVESIKDEVHTAIRMDGRDRETLEARGIHEIPTTVICMGEDFEAAEICAVHLAELGCPEVLVRGTTRERVEILRALGAKVITPGLNAARRLAAALISTAITHYTSPPGEDDIALMEIPPAADGMTLESLGVGTNFKVRVLALRRGLSPDTETFVGPGQTQSVRPKDDLFLLARESELVKFADHLTSL